MHEWQRRTHPLEHGLDNDGTARPPHTTRSDRVLTGRYGLPPSFLSISWWSRVTNNIEILYFLVPMIAFCMIALAYQFHQYIPGIMGGLVLLSYGVVVLLNPIAGIPDLMNMVIGNAAWMYGAYVFLGGSVDRIGLDLPY
jgi:hypothetical protein